jgi:DNA-binding CsgD family transcriptional regulator
VGNADLWTKTLSEIDRLPIPLRETVQPHVARAREIFGAVNGWKSSAAAWKNVVEEFSSPVFLVDSHSVLQHANEAGHKALNVGDYLVLRQGKVDFPLEAQQKSTLVSVIQSLWESDSPRRSALRLHAADGRIAVLTVRPLRVGSSSFDALRAEAALFLSVPRPSFDTEILQHLFDLTPAETRLAEQLLWGEELTVLAEQWNVSRETLKSQLDRLFQKTGTHRQTQLVAFLLSALSMRLW